MKLYNLIIDGCCHLAADNGSGIMDLTAAGFPLDMEGLIRADALCEAAAFLRKPLPVVENPV